MYSDINDEYFEYLYDIVCTQSYSKNIYRRLLRRLFYTDFTYVLRKDENRAIDGEDLRSHFAIDRGYDVYDTIADLGRPCSVLEMMIALSYRCENWLGCTAYGDRTSQWFWNMLVTMGLGPMTDEMYDEACVSVTLRRFLNRDYESDGKGGLFRVYDTDEDMRKIDYWKQLCMYMAQVD